MVAADLWRTALGGVLPLVDHGLAAVYAIAFGLPAGPACPDPFPGTSRPPGGGTGGRTHNAVHMLR